MITKLYLLFLISILSSKTNGFPAYISEYTYDVEDPFIKLQNILRQAVEDTIELVQGINRNMTQMVVDKAKYLEEQNLNPATKSMKDKYNSIVDSVKDSEKMNECLEQSQLSTFWSTYDARAWSAFQGIYPIIDAQIMSDYRNAQTGLRKNVLNNAASQKVDYCLTNHLHHPLEVLLACGYDEANNLRIQWNVLTNKLKNMIDAAVAKFDPILANASTNIQNVLQEFVTLVAPKEQEVKACAAQVTIP